MAETSPTSLTGNEAAARAAMLARVGIVGYFPIGPSDEVVETIAKAVDRGRYSATIMQLANEKSCVNGQIAATEAGVRSLFATNSEGLLFAAEQIKHAALARIPIVITVANRALEPPLVVAPDYQDTIMFRDAFWLQFYCENAQEVLDTTLQAYRLAEHPEIMLPAFVCYEGWEISHGAYPCVIPAQADVDRFLPAFAVPPERDIATWNYAGAYGERTLKFGAAVLETYMAIRRKLAASLDRAKDVIARVHREYVDSLGRGMGGLLEVVATDADVILVTMGAITATARLAVEALRLDGQRVGLVKIRTYRPFPAEALAAAVGHARVVVVIERDMSAAVFHELRSALYALEARPRVLGRIAGIGGKDVTLEDVISMAEEGVRATTEQNVPELAWHMEREALLVRETR